MIPDATIGKLVGLLSSAATVMFSGIVAEAIGWMTPAKEFVLFLTSIGGFIGVCFYATNLALDSCKKFREERQARRNEIREIEDAICRRRRTLDQCPLLRQNDNAND